jgi:hypothetical protein
MSEILLPENAVEEKDGEGQQTFVGVDYKATEEDEERFFLMYHMNFQPSEAEGLNVNYRKWLIARFVAQKNMEREMVERHRIMQQISPNLKV